MGYGLDQQGQGRDENRDRNESYGNFDGHEILKDRIWDHDFADLIHNRLKKIVDVQRVPPPFKRVRLCLLSGLDLRGKHNGNSDSGIYICRSGFLK